jgi:hypothetical protein
VPLVLRAWLRYIVPLTVLSAIAVLPLWWLASRVGVAKDLPQARAQLRVAWFIGASAIACQLWLVAAVAPAVRGLADGTPPSQLRAFAQGLRGLARGFWPALIAVIAVALGGIALVVPGLLLLVLLSLTGASTRVGDPVPAPLLDSVTVVRANLKHVAFVVAAIVVADLVITAVLQWQLVPHITRKVAASKLATIRSFIRTLPFAIAVVSPLAACALAAAYVRLTRRTT